MRAFAAVLSSPLNPAYRRGGDQRHANHSAVRKRPRSTTRSPMIAIESPNVGWHTQGGMRVCTQDCDNPEIPGSGYTCDVTSSAWRCANALVELVTVKTAEYRETPRGPA